MPYPYLLASTADKHRGSLTHYSTHRAPWNRSPCVPVRAVYPIFRFFVLVTPFRLFLNGFGIDKNEKSKNVFSGGISASSFCHLTNETPTRLFFHSAFLLLFFVFFYGALTMGATYLNKK